MQKIYYKQLDSPANVYSLSKFATRHGPSQDQCLIVTSKDIYILRFDTEMFKLKCERLQCPSQLLPKECMFISQCSFEA